MYDRFSDRARKVMQLANQEAQRFNHEYIGTEHILLGVIKEGSGIAAEALKNLDVDLRKIRLEVEKVVKSGPDMITMGKLPQTPRAKKVIDLAIEEARHRNEHYVGTEHIVLGLLLEKEGVAAEVLNNLGVTLDDFRGACRQHTGNSVLEMVGKVRRRLNIKEASTKAGSDVSEERYSKLRDEICCTIIADLSTNKSAAHTINSIMDRLSSFNTNG